LPAEIQHKGLWWRRHAAATGKREGVLPAGNVKRKKFEGQQEEPRGLGEQ